MAREVHCSDHDLVLALDEELNAARAAAVSSHLRACVDCRTRQQCLAAAAQACATGRGDLEEYQHPPGARARLRARLADAGRMPPRAGGPRSAPGVTAMLRWAAAVAATVVFAFVAPRHFAGPDSIAQKTSSPAIEADARPIAWLTPGATADLSRDDLCGRRRVPQPTVPPSVRSTVVRAYGMEQVSPDDYELDYLITPELGGAPHAENLWPQRYASRLWNAGVKDQLEDLLPVLVCDGRISLRTAQQDIARDWIDAYKRYFHTERPLGRQGRAAASTEAVSRAQTRDVFSSGTGIGIRSLLDLDGSRMRDKTLIAHSGPL